MIFDEQPLSGVFRLRPERSRDERGFFARTFSAAESAQHGLEFAVAEASVSFNERRGTLRGLHLQVPPHEEAKLVRCVAGSMYDVVLDLRPGSPTQLDWLAVELDAEEGSALLIPPGFAHGFLTLEDGCELEYLISAGYAPSAAAGVRWDDPAVAIEWPFAPVVISARDAAFPDLDLERLRAHGPAALLPGEGAA